MSYEQPTYAELARDALAKTMSDISEECWFAGWMKGNEVALWTSLKTGDREYGATEIQESDLARLKHLHELAGGWWIWPDDEDHPRFVPTNEWLGIFDKRKSG